jgi:hypothetical protein
VGSPSVGWLLGAELGQEQQHALGAKSVPDGIKEKQRLPGERGSTRLVI